MLIDDERRLPPALSTDASGLEEYLGGFEPMYISPTDVQVCTRDGSKLKLRPGETAELACVEHPYIQAYGSEAQISLRSILAQSGLDIAASFDPSRHRMSIEVTNHGPNTFYTNHPFPIGAVFLPGDPLDHKALKALEKCIEVTEALPRSAKPKALFPDSVPGIHTATLGLPVVYTYELLEEGRNIPLARLGTGTDPHYVQLLNGISALPLTHSRDEIARASVGLRISSSAKLRLPAGVALLIQNGVRYENGDVVMVPHTESRLVKGHSATNGGNYSPHRIRFETFGAELPDTVPCEVYVFQYAEF